MGRIKLTEPGQSHTMHVRSVTENKSGSWPEWEFTDGTDTLAVPQNAMARQLTRLGMDSALEMAGATVEFSRSEKLGANKKPFWNVEIVNAAAAQPKPASSRVKPTEADPTKGLPPSFGGPIKGLDDEPEPYRDDDDARFEAFSAAVDSLDPAAQPALTPREVAQQVEAVDKQAQVLETYTELYEAMLARLAAAHFRVNQTMTGVRATDKVALTSDTVQAATFSIFKTWRDKGWV